MRGRYAVLAVLVAAALGVVAGRSDAVTAALRGSARIAEAARTAATTRPGNKASTRVVGRLSDGAADYTDPASPAYDPQYLLVTEGRLGRDVFSNEPRVERWAVPMERKLRDSLAEDLAVQAPSAEVKELECRTALCKVDVSIPSDQWDQIGDAYPIFALGTEGGGVSDGYFDDEGRTHASFYLFFEAGDRDPEAWSRWWPAQRARSIEEARKKGKLTAEPRP
jgi:hypothetical protein